MQRAFRNQVLVILLTSTGVPQGFETSDGKNSAALCLMSKNSEIINLALQHTAYLTRSMAQIAHILHNSQGFNTQDEL